jgi:hypothetical protein
LVIADTSAPTITSVSPADGDINVAVNGAITVQFNKAMDVSTIKNAAGFITLADAAATNVPVSVAYDVTNNTATVTPTTLLSTATAYTVTVGTSIKAANAVAMESASSKTFTTSTNQMYATIKSARYVLASDSKSAKLYLTLSNPLKTGDATTTALKAAASNVALDAIFTVGNGAFDAADTITTAYTNDSTLITISIANAGGVLSSFTTGTSTISVKASQLLDGRGITLSTSAVTMQ